uniref:Cytochrome b n=1 Tax=Coelioxys fenestrata TaxID=621226 RepID=A0A7T5BMT5_9HYME|nr:cytochrome b [Coelioxys fenestrata]QQD78154.1 cytochrome b [Coelioxys fenestrata]
MYIFTQRNLNEIMSMMKIKFLKFMKSNKIFNMIYNSIIVLPSPLNINYTWNFGSILGMFLLIQLISGIMLSMHFCPNTMLAFKSIIHIIKDVNSGWMVRNIHMNGASFYFLFIYLHISRNMYYQNYSSYHVWNMGILIFLISMMTAFMGYVLPWGQMSFWGATVITSLISAIPYIGQMTVEWIWGGFSINNATLNRFFSLHFIMPFIILFMVMLHLFFLHLKGSNNPLGNNNNIYKIPFHPYFSLKDLLGIYIVTILFIFFVIKMPYILSDPDNFTPANPMNTPNHIKPEWYFLFAYSILRCIPNKLGGVIALLLSILILFIMPLLMNYKMKSNKFYPFNQYMYWIHMNSFITLTWLGGQLIEYPYIFLNTIFTNLYFLFYFIYPLMMKIWDYLIFK